jgi:hypothetical protein
VGRGQVKKPKLYGGGRFPKFREKPKFKNLKFRERKNFEKFFFKVCCDYHSVFGLSFDAYICARMRARKTKNRVYLQMYML